jgi:hypothetical protein
MTDLLYIAITIGFFLTCFGLIAFFDVLTRTKE